MPLNPSESRELLGYLGSMFRQKDVVGVQDTPGTIWGGLHYWCLYGWRVTGEPIFKHQDSWKWKDSQGIDLKEEDVHMFIVFGSIWKGSSSIFMDRYYGWKFITSRLIAFQNLDDAATDLGLKVMIDPISLWLYIDDSVTDSTTIQPSVQGQVESILQQVLDTLQDLKKKSSGQGPSTTSNNGIDIEIDKIKIAVHRLQNGFGIS